MQTLETYILNIFNYCDIGKETSGSLEVCVTSYHKLPKIDF